MRLKSRSYQDTLEELARTVSIIPVNDADIVSRSGTRNNYPIYYFIVSVNKIAVLYYNDGIFCQKYKVKK